MILNFLATKAQLTINDITYFCLFAGLTTTILYIFYVVILKGKIEDNN